MITVNDAITSINLMNKNGEVRIKFNGKNLETGSQIWNSGVVDNTPLTGISSVNFQNMVNGLIRRVDDMVDSEEYFVRVTSENNVATFAVARDLFQKTK